MSAALSPSRHTVSRHASRRGEWRMEFLAPSSRLAPFVRLFDAYAESGTGRLRRRELPSGLATLVFNLGAELRVEYPLETHTRYGAGAGFYTGLGSTPRPLVRAVSSAFLSPRWATTSSIPPS